MVGILTLRRVRRRRRGESADEPSTESVTAEAETAAEHAEAAAEHARVAGEMALESLREADETVDGDGEHPADAARSRAARIRKVGRGLVNR